MCIPAAAWLSGHRRTVISGLYKEGLKKRPTYRAVSEKLNMPLECLGQGIRGLDKGGDGIFLHVEMPEPHVFWVNRETNLNCVDHLNIADKNGTRTISPSARQDYVAAASDKKYVFSFRAVSKVEIPGKFDGLLDLEAGSAAQPRGQRFRCPLKKCELCGFVLKYKTENKATLYGLDGAKECVSVSVRCSNKRSCGVIYRYNYRSALGKKVNIVEDVEKFAALFVNENVGFTLQTIKYLTELWFRGGISVAATMAASGVLWGKTKEELHYLESLF